MILLFERWGWVDGGGVGAGSLSSKKKGGGQNSLLTRLKLTEMDQSKQRHLKAFVSWKWLSVAGLASLTADWSSAWPSGIPNTPDLSPDEPGLGALAFPCVPLLSSLTSTSLAMFILPTRQREWRFVLENVAGNLLPSQWGMWAGGRRSGVSKRLLKAVLCTRICCSPSCAPTLFASVNWERWPVGQML